MDKKVCCCCGAIATVQSTRIIPKPDGTYERRVTYWCDYDWSELHKDIGRTQPMVFNQKRRYGR